MRIFLLFIGITIGFNACSVEKRAFDKESYERTNSAYEKAHENLNREK